MTPQERKVMELALNALTHGGCPPDCKDGMTDSGGVHPWGEAALIPCPNCQTITAIKEALAQEQEQDGECKYCTDGCPACDARKLPAQRKPLTDEEIAVERALDNLLYWTERAVNKGNANLDIEEAMQQYNDALAAAHDIKE